MWLASYNLYFITTCNLYSYFISESHKSAHDNQGYIIILCVVISCLFIPTVIIVIWRMEKYRKKPGL